jgi:amylosucrase
VQNVLHLTPESRARFERCLAACEGVLAPLPSRDRDLFELRLERWFQHLDDGLAAVYGRRPDYDAFVERLVATLAAQHADRPDSLKRLDVERDLTPDWFQRERMVGYVFYVERFAGDLRGVVDHLDYLSELGVTYVHLMYVLRPREGENDGGYAIADYRDVDPRLGTIDDLEALCVALRERGIATCVDLVLNHCADTHAWALAAKSGDARHLDYFYAFPDRAEPEAYEATLPEVFPDFAPGNFTWEPSMGRWVWTTFHAYQWDLNWSNPEVFLEVIGIMGDLANRGIDVFRMDAVAFMWKRLGTDCQNQPEVHDLLQALRACSKIATPAVAHKAEAIVSPNDLIHYFGTGRRYGKVANIAYHNSLMVQTWSALASRDARLMTRTLGAFPPTPPSIAWGCYVRCHDDIGWAVTDEDAAAVGWNGAAHRHFLSDFYSGQFPGTFARGAVFQFNPATGDRRISGTCASLAGLEGALEAGEAGDVTMAIERILWAHALACGFGGIPLLYMGDELGMRNDLAYLRDPEHRADNRWLHRPPMDWLAADRRHLPDTVEARLFGGLVKILRARSRTPHLHAQTPSEVLDLGHPRVFAQLRRHPLGPLLALYNVADDTATLDAAVFETLGLRQPYDQLEGRFVDVGGGPLTLRPYDRLWLT